MKYYIDENNEVFAYPKDGSQDKFIGDDKVQMTTEEIKAHLDPTLTKEQQEEKLKVDAKTAIQNMLNTKAQEYGYDDIISASSYASPTHLENALDEKFRLEGNAFYAWRSACWSSSISYMAEVENAILEAETNNKTYILPTVEDVLAKMPTLDL